MKCIQYPENDCPARDNSGCTCQPPGGWPSKVTPKEYTQLLESLRVPHLVVDGDCWFSCPKSGQCCNDGEDKDHCNCGADAHNAKVDAAVAAVERFFSEATSSRWIPLTERMPPNDGTRFVARNSAGYSACVTGLFQTPGGWDGEDSTPEDTSFPIGDVVEWLPLPEAPKEGRT